jgi:hypothetical protein
MIQYADVYSYMQTAQGFPILKDCQDCWPLQLYWDQYVRNRKARERNQPKFSGSDAGTDEEGGSGRSEAGDREAIQTQNAPSDHTPVEQKPMAIPAISRKVRGLLLSSEQWNESVLRETNKPEIKVACRYPLVLIRTPTSCPVRVYTQQIVGTKSTDATFIDVAAPFAPVHLLVRISRLRCFRSLTITRRNESFL